MMALGAMMASAYQAVTAIDEDARITFGDINVDPGVRNTVPETVTLAVDIRHPDESVLGQIETAVLSIVEEQAAKHRVGSEIREEWHSPALVFDTNCIAAVEDASKHLGVPAQRIVSGAGHDSVYVARVAPTSMIFVPCEGGISHNEAEDAEPGDLEAGCNVLLGAVVGMAS